MVLKIFYVHNIIFYNILLLSDKVQSTYWHTVIPHVIYFHIHRIFYITSYILVYLLYKKKFKLQTFIVKFVCIKSIF